MPAPDTGAKLFPCYGQKKVKYMAPHPPHTLRAKNIPFPPHTRKSREVGLRGRRGEGVAGREEPHVGRRISKYSNNSYTVLSSCIFIFEK